MKFKKDISCKRVKFLHGFTLIELLVVIAIIGILATLAVVALQQARSRARDSKRVADIKQAQTALELFYNENGRYPTTEEWESGSIVSSSTGEVFMYNIPVAPTPADGDCSGPENDYTYIPNIDNSDYDLNFCVGNSPSGLPDGNLVAFSGGIKSGTESGAPEEDVCDPVCDYGYNCEGTSCVLKDNFFVSLVYGSVNWSDDKELVDLTSDSQYIYAAGNNELEGAGQLDGMIVKYDKDSMSIEAKRVYGGAGKDDLESIVEQGDYLYTAGTVNSGASGNASLTKYNKSDLSLVSALSLGSSGSSSYTLTRDDNYLYIGVGNTVMVYDFDLNLIKQNSYTNSITSITIDGNYLYLASSAGNKITTLKVDKNTMSVDSENAYGRTGIIFFPTFRGSVDDSYYYVYGQIIGEGPAGRNGLILKYDKSDLSLLGKKIYGSADTDYFGSLCLSGEFLYAVGYTGGAFDGSGDLWLNKINRSDLSLVSSEVIRESNLDTWGYEDTYSSSCLYENQSLYFTAYVDEYDDEYNNIFGNSAALIKIKSDFVSSDASSSNSIFTVSPYTLTTADSNLDITDPNISSQVGTQASNPLVLSSSVSNLDIYGPYIIE
ncbi:hypothetical protein CVU82_01720 [Candidatus Falkowbacteria bacterium HGW-Falkowbacteria-1]|uniref:Type II secretion system protein GspG C-terminal domain-containing protein n=1 Tax=Candidatus Falkowbacteria bacterium HGW-Falkowbacteria-1 TaxID=2013768 RepID=A0A2N2E9C3_9BACT|nr:MAG: hypothetical protein CVU82_01720 [Candidatus Falkowbacteria bacterium HGW-Falkowbacteria-1]